MVKSDNWQELLAMAPILSPVVASYIEGDYLYACCVDGYQFLMSASGSIHHLQPFDSQYIH